MTAAQHQTLAWTTGIGKLRAAAQRRGRQLAAAVRSTVGVLSASAFIITLLLAAGVAMTAAGVYIMLGRGPALLAGGIFAFALAALIARGANG